MRRLIADSKGRLTLGKAYAGQVFHIKENNESVIIELVCVYRTQKKIQKGLDDVANGRLYKNAIDLDQYV